MVKTELIPCKEERYNCPVYDCIDTLTGMLDAAEERIDELEEANERLGAALKLMCLYKVEGGSHP